MVDADVINSSELKIQKKRSVKTNFIWAIIGLLVVFGTCLIIVNVFSVSNSLDAYFEESIAEKVLSFQADYTERGAKLFSFLTLVNESGDFAGLIRDGNKMRISNYLSKFAQASSVTSVHIIDKEGTVLYSTDQSMEGSTKFKYSSVFYSAKVSCPIYKICTVGDNVAYVAINNLDVYDMGFHGYIVLEDDLSTNKAVDYYKSLLGAEFTVFNDDVRIATSIMNAAGERITGTKLNNDTIYKVVYEENEVYYGQNIINDENYVTAYIPAVNENKEERALFFIGLPVTIISHTQNSILNLVIPVIVVFCVFIVVVTILLLRRLILKPLDKVAVAIHHLADDSDEADLTYRIGIKGNDEICNLAKDVDIFLSRQQSLIQELKVAEESLDLIGNSLGTSSQETAGAISEIMANIEGVKKQTEHQMSAVNSANEELENSVRQVKALDGLIENQSAGIIESSSAIEQMVGNIASVSNSVKKMNDEFDELTSVTEVGQGRQAEVDTKVTEMASQSKLLMEANSVITRIASQTNLLAMNAAIEAAHAGEAGAGFSVVADEIRTLAENSSKQSHNIGQELKNITKTISEVVSSSQQSREAFRTITSKLSDTGNLVREIDQAMSEQDAASKQVLEALRDVNNSTSQVQSTAKDMNEAVDKVNLQMRSVTATAETVLGSMDEMSAGAVQINRSAQEVSDMANETRTNIRGMDQLIGRFKV
ncbi:MAG: cache domain-containing protein [Treponemataceae bacterium]|nr:cache domain-containing protein [Treponemataceae bacterium]